MDCEWTLLGPGCYTELLQLSKTTAGLHHHVPVFLKDHVVVVVIEKDRDGAELGGCAARLRNLVRLQEMDLFRARYQKFTEHVLRFSTIKT